KVTMIDSRTGAVVTVSTMVSTGATVDGMVSVVAVSFSRLHPFPNKNQSNSSNNGINNHHKPPPFLRSSSRICATGRSSARFSIRVTGRTIGSSTTTSLTGSTIGSRSEGGVTGLPSTTPGCESNEEPRTPRFNPEGNAARKSDLLLSNNPEIRLVSQSVPFFVKAPITPGSAVLNNCITELPLV